MKKIICLAFFLTAVFSFSQDKGFGVGIIVGEPTGFSLKGWLTKTSAIDAGLAWSFVNEGSLHVHADYLFHFYNVFNVSSGKLPIYVGVGGRIKIKNNKNNSDERIGIRVPVGLDYMFADAPIDVFLEIAPIIDLTPKTDISVNGGVGVRFFF